MLERLRGVEGVAQLAGAPQYPGSIVIEDVGGAGLAGLAKPLAPEDLAWLAVELAQAVAGMHRRAVMHRDISPANIVIGRGGDPCLVDFALAVSFTELGPGSAHHGEIAGTLAYLAPEQTGRTGRLVDQRADLYALGATLYELATGEPPFGSGDALRLTHDHLARVPVPPAEVNRAVPGLLSGIIMHLLEKEPDNRYQTAEGLLYDLEQSRAGQTAPAAATRGVGTRDFPLRLPPSRLVGRDDDVAALRAAFEDALAGRCRGVLVSGAPGVGKTALADELRQVVTGRDGWFVAGKFDPYRRDLEFDAVNQAFRALGRLLLAEPDDELAGVRERILAAGRPERWPADRGGAGVRGLAGGAIRGGGPADRSGPGAAHDGAGATGGRLLRKRPLVVFLDDLQWAGCTQLGAVDLVLREEPVNGLLLVGAYREEDLDAAHPLAAPLSRWRDQAVVRHLRLANLARPKPDHHRGGDAAGGPGGGGGTGRGDLPVHLRESVRDRGVGQSAAPRRRAGRDGRRMAVG